MRSALILGCILLASLVASPAVAGEPDSATVERIMLDLEKLIGRLEGVDYDALPVKDLGNGLYKVAIPLPEGTRERLLASSASAADFKTMAVGLQLSTPTSPSSVIMAVDALDNTDYNFWFAVGNLRTTDQRKRTIFQLKGPGDRFRLTDNILYEALRLVVFFTEQSSGDTGFHTIQAKVANGGKAKAIYFAQ